MPDFTALFWILGGAIALLLLTFFIILLLTYGGFSRELRQLNLEIQRTHGRQRRYYKKMRRGLWFSWLTLRYH